MSVWLTSPSECASLIDHSAAAPVEESATGDADQAVAQRQRRVADDLQTIAFGVSRGNDGEVVVELRDAAESLLAVAVRAYDERQPERGQFALDETQAREWRARAKKEIIEFHLGKLRWAEVEFLERRRGQPPKRSDCAGQLRYSHSNTLSAELASTSSRARLCRRIGFHFGDRLAQTQLQSGDQLFQLLPVLQDPAEETVCACEHADVLELHRHEERDFAYGADAVKRGFALEQ